MYVNETAGYQIPARWQTVLSQAANIGGFVGILICGRVAPRLGYRWTIIGALACMNAFIFLTFFATSLGMLLAGELLLGLTWGFFVSSSRPPTLYIAQTTEPYALRSLTADRDCPGVRVRGRPTAAPGRADQLHPDLLVHWVVYRFGRALPHELAHRPRKWRHRR